MGYISTWMGDHLSTAVMSLMALWLELVERNPFRPVSINYATYVYLQKSLTLTNNLYQNIVPAY